MIADWPQDGKLVIPRLNAAKANAGITSASWTGGSAESSVSFKQLDGNVVVTVPKAPVDPLMSVLKVELDGAPVVVDKPGSYDVNITYGSMLNSGTFALEVAGQTFEKEVKVAGKAKKPGPFSPGFRLDKLGKVQFDKPDVYTVSVKALEIFPEAIACGRGLIWIREVVLSKN